MWVISKPASAILVALLGVAAGAMAAPQSVVDRLAGRYTHTFLNGDIDGGSGYSTDVIEIFPIDHDRALVKFELNFFNGHMCDAFGDARVENGKLVYRDNQSEWGLEGECRLTIWQDQTHLRWEDDGSCQFKCGSRGGFFQWEDVDP